MSLPDPKPLPLDHLALRGRADSTALVTKAESISFAELDQMVGRMAHALLAAGLNAGDRVASWLNKTAEACILPLATARAGLVHVPVNPALKHGQVSHILADSGAKLLISGEGRLTSLQLGDIPAQCRVWTEKDAMEARLTGKHMPPSAHDPDGLCAILYTSGSTGKSKGVMLSHANLWLGAISVADYLGLAADDRTLAVLPLSFDYGQNQLLSTWAAGGAAYPLDYLTGRDVVRAIERNGITTLAGVPPLWVQLVETEWPETARAAIRRLTNSGGALTPPLVAQLRAIVREARLFAMYGLTEAFRSTYLDPALIDSHPTSIGGAIPFAEILVVKADGSEAGPEEPGELVHCGPLVSYGYWRDDERTALRFKPAPAFSRYGGMAVWSGDTVRKDAEGLLYFVGRDDEMIKTSGNRVSPAEVEEIAVSSGVVREAVALGVPDPRLGQSIVLVARGEAGREADMLAHFRRELPSFMQPRHVLWRADLPRNPNGKLDRVAIRNEVMALSLEKAA